MESAVKDIPDTETFQPPDRQGGEPDPVKTISPAGLLVSAVALGCALQVNFGQYHPAALAWLTVAAVTCAMSVLAPGQRLLRLLDAHVGWVTVGALLTQLALLLTRSPGATGRLASGGPLWFFKWGATVGIALACAASFVGSRWRATCVFAMLVTYAALGAWVLRATPSPGVDVIVFQRDGAQALLRGENPYALTFPSPYQDASRFYGPGAVGDGRLLFGYPYPPLSLLMALPGHALGDVRYAQLIAMSAAGALVAFARPGRKLGAGAAAVLLFTPRGFFVLEAGWTEPFAVLLLALTVFVACRRRWSVAVPLGLLVAMKQYLVLSLLVAPLLGRRGVAWKALVIAAAVTVPFALWDLAAFVHSAVLLQFRQPFREDALSYLAGVAHATGWRLPAWVAAGPVIAAVVLLLRKAPRTPAGFAAGLGLVCFALFAFNKQAFCNYYHFVIGSLCCAAGAVRNSQDSDAGF